MASKEVRKGQKKGVCQHFMAVFDSHRYCPTCRENLKGDDACVLKNTDCVVCRNFTPEEKKRLEERKRYVRKANKGSVQQTEEDLLGESDGSSLSAESRREIEQEFFPSFHDPPPSTNVALGDQVSQNLGLTRLSLNTPARPAETVPATPRTEIALLKFHCSKQDSRIDMLLKMMQQTQKMHHFKQHIYS